MAYIAFFKTQMPACCWVVCLLISSASLSGLCGRRPNYGCGTAP